jgi:hypothetical protein
MWRKRAVIRLLAIAGLYCAVFFALIMIQFTKRGNFTLRAGNMLISGQYLLEDGVKAEAPDRYPLEGGVSVYFGGLEFCLKEKTLSR